MSADTLRIMQVVSDLEVGGAQEVVRTLAEFLNRVGCETVVCTFRDGPLRAQIEKQGIPVEVLPERRHSVIALPLFIIEMLQIRHALVRLVKKYNLDVIQTQLLRSMDFLVLSLRLNSGPLVFWTFQNALFDLREDHLAKRKWLLKPKRWSHHMLYRLGSKMVSGIVAVSEDVRTSILETMPGIPPEKISVIPNRVDVSRYGNRDQRGVVRSILGFSDDDHLMTVVATLKPQKGHTILLSAMAEIATRFPQLHILIAGDGILRADLETRTNSLNLTNRVHFLGTRSDIPDLLAASDSFVLPSLWEGLSMALCEAMASELPVIATDVSGTREVMIPGETGLLVPASDSHELANAMSAILSDPAKAQMMAAAARRRVEIHYSAQTQAREHLALYQHAMQSQPRRLAAATGELHGR